MMDEATLCVLVKGSEEERRERGGRRGQGGSEARRGERKAG